jgi:hypothetical protein
VFNVYPTLEADFYFADISTAVAYEKMHQLKYSVMSINENNNSIHPNIRV